MTKLYYYITVAIIIQFGVLGFLDLIQGKYGSMAMNVSLVFLYLSIYVLIGKWGVK